MRVLAAPLITLTLLGAATLTTEGCVTKAPPPARPPEAEPATSGSAAGGGASADGSSHANGSSAAAAAGTDKPRAGAQTSEERRAALDKRLSDSLGSFDARLRKEQQKVAAERDARQVTVAGTTAADAGSDKTDAGPTARSEDSGNRAGRPGDLKSDRSAGRSAGNAEASPNGATAREIPDGSDDDVVARRLRKAAEQETDPELKEKLWKEYANYKKNTQEK